MGRTRKGRLFGRHIAGSPDSFVASWKSARDRLGTCDDAFEYCRPSSSKRNILTRDQNTQLPIEEALAVNEPPLMRVAATASAGTVLSELATSSTETVAGMSIFKTARDTRLRFPRTPPNGMNTLSHLRTEPEHSARDTLRKEMRSEWDKSGEDIAKRQMPNAFMVYIWPPPYQSVGADENALSTCKSRGSTPRLFCV